MPPKRIVNRNSLLEQAVNKGNGNLKTVEQADVGKFTVQPSNLRKLITSGSASRLPQQIIQKVPEQTKMMTEADRLIGQRKHSKGSSTPLVFSAPELTEINSLDFPTIIASNLLQRHELESQTLDNLPDDKHTTELTSRKDQTIPRGGNLVRKQQTLITSPANRKSSNYASLIKLSSMNFPSKKPPALNSTQNLRRPPK